MLVGSLIGLGILTMVYTVAGFIYYVEHYVEHTIWVLVPTGFVFGGFLIVVGRELQKRLDGEEE